MAGEPVQGAGHGPLRAARAAIGAEHGFAVAFAAAGKAFAGAAHPGVISVFVAPAQAAERGNAHSIGHAFQVGSAQAAQHRAIGRHAAALVDEHFGIVEMFFFERRQVELECFGIELGRFDRRITDLESIEVGELVVDRFELRLGWLGIDGERNEGQPDNDNRVAEPAERVPTAFFPKPFLKLLDLVEFFEQFFFGQALRVGREQRSRSRGAGLGRRERWLRRNRHGARRNRHGARWNRHGARRHRLRAERERLRHRHGPQGARAHSRIIGRAHETCPFSGSSWGRKNGSTRSVAKRTDATPRANISGERRLSSDLKRLGTARPRNFPARGAAARVE